MARGLARRIYQHVMAEGWAVPGSVVLDPFSGVGGFALDAMAAGLHFVGIELEQRFVDMAQGCDCTGISKADWIRFYGRFARVAYTGGRHWCPACLHEAEIIEEQGRQLEFMGHGSASYVRNSGQIPHTEPHHYTGNIELWRRRNYPGTAVILQGDSRNLAEIVRAAGLVCGSPPYSNRTVHGQAGIDLTVNPNDRTGAGSMIHTMDRYGDTPGNLGNLPAGTLALGSPPYADGARHTGGSTRNTTGQGGPIAFVDYGDAPGQLGAMPAGTLSLSSPPYISSVNQSEQANDNAARLERKAAAGVDIGQAVNRGGPNSVLNQPQAYGNTPGQLGAMPAGEPGTTPGNLATLCASSPPWEASLSGKGECPELRPDGTPFGQGQSIDLATYGTNPANIGNQQGETFWGAAKTIICQLHQVLSPGAHCVWVCKRFVRSGEIVNFSAQWAALCESCGFRLLHWHRAMLTEERGTQLDLNGEAVTKTVAHRSFFRQLHAQKYPHLAIDWEDVLCFERVP